MTFGADIRGNGRCVFRVWAPGRKSVEVKLEADPPRRIPMVGAADGCWSVEAEDVSPGTLYRYVLDGALDRPDPASASQPQGVHGPSAVVDHGSFRWSDGGWKGLPLENWVLYELHVGTFTPEGTFDAAISRLDPLVELGVKAVEVMPLAQFPGERNWGYDGTCPYAVQSSYGGPEGFKRFVDAVHSRGMAVVLDVVYNHLGPEGNYLRDFGPFFTERYHTPWGSALNFDGPQSDAVRRFFVENARSWFRDYHVDGLRLDAIHGICDLSAAPFLADLAQAAEDLSGELGRRCLLIGESDLNDVRAIRPRALGGFGLDAQWSDDFHHSLHVLLTGEQEGYYRDFSGVSDLAKAYGDAFVYSGQYSRFRARRHGNSAAGFPGQCFVVFSQNHDQVGNRMLGERLSTLVGFEALKLAAGALLTAPFVPLLFMGEEYGETAPFLYFISHSDPALVRAVREGRRREFAGFQRAGEAPDPQALGTFERSRLRWDERGQGRHGVLLRCYAALLALRARTPALARLDRAGVRVEADEERGMLLLERRCPEGGVRVFMNFSGSPQTLGATPEGRWRKLFDSADRVWDGPGASMPELLVSGAGLPPSSIAIYGYEP